VSRSHRFVAESRDLRAMRYRLGKLEPYMYVYMHMYPEDPCPRWFVLHPPATSAQTGAPFELLASGSTSRILLREDGLGCYRSLSLPSYPHEDGSKRSIRKFDRQEDISVWRVLGCR
ncbi:unnamed protein product, partial [Brassica rapa subsp. trilocularis]